MGTPGDRGEGPEQPGGWQSGGWQSEWQQPGGWQQEPQQQPPPQPTGPGGWTQTPDGRWVQTGPSSSGKATASLVLGILGLVFCPLVCSVLALVFGYQARNEIDGSGGRISGRGSATAGIVLGWIGVVICALFLILVVIGVLTGDSTSTGAPSGVPA
jgi:Domain of unknown function (DUF4190)